MYVIIYEYFALNTLLRCYIVIEGGGGYKRDKDATRVSNLLLKVNNILTLEYQSLPSDDIISQIKNIMSIIHPWSCLPSSQPRMIAMIGPVFLPFFFGTSIRNVSLQLEWIRDPLHGVLEICLSTSAL